MIFLGCATIALSLTKFTIKKLTILRIKSVSKSMLVDLRLRPQDGGAPVECGPGSGVLVVIVVRVAVLGCNIAGQHCGRAGSDDAGDDDLGRGDEDYINTTQGITLWYPENL